MAQDESPPSKRMSRRYFLNLFAVATTGLVVSSGGGFYYSAKVEPNNIEVTEVTVPIKNLPSAFEGFRITHISDIHAGTWMNTERLTTVVNRVNQQNADLIVITGDYVTEGNLSWVADTLLATLPNLSAPDGVLSVLGNHDHWTNPGGVREILQACQIHELRNESVVLERESTRLAIAGVDDVWEHKADLSRAIKSLPDDVTPAILLAHEPDYADISAESGRFALQLSGHSHGGQVRIPLLGAPVLPYLGEKYSIGRYQVRDMVQYTNRGVGMIPPTLRFGCPPEITVFTLIRQTQ